MPLDLDADLHIFFQDSGDIAQAAGSEPFTVLFSDGSKNLALFDREVNSTAPFFLSRQSDIDANFVENGTLITINNQDYAVTNVAPDGAGLAVVTLTNA